MRLDSVNILSHRFMKVLPYIEKYLNENIKNIKYFYFLILVEYFFVILVEYFTALEQMK